MKVWMVRNEDDGTFHGIFDSEESADNFMELAGVKGMDALCCEVYSIKSSGDANG